MLAGASLSAAEEISSMSVVHSFVVVIPDSGSSKLNEKTDVISSNTLELSNYIPTNMTQNNIQYVTPPTKHKKKH